MFDYFSKWLQNEYNEIHSSLDNFHPMRIEQFLDNGSIFSPAFQVEAKNYN
jgi:hypothetical protein